MRLMRITKFSRWQSCLRFSMRDEIALRLRVQTVPKVRSTLAHAVCCDNFA